MSIGISTVIDTGRALMAALQPLTGARAVGQMRVKMKPGLLIELPEHTYFIPIIDGARHPSWLFKVTAGPNPNRSWTVDDSGNTLVTVVSNIGGIRHNVPKDTQFVTDIDVEGMVTSGLDQAKAEADFEQASDPEKFGVQDMVLYETFDGPALSLDLRRSPLRAFPGVLIAFQDMTPADGTAISQVDQSAVNAGDGKKFYKIGYSISVIVSRTDGDHSRRFMGLVIADTICALLNDKHAGDANEPLSNPGGVQVRQLVREDGPQDIYKKFYIYTLMVSCMRAVTRLDFRTFSPWLRTLMNVQKPQLPPLPNQGDFPMVQDVLIDMTPGQLDFAIDGVFTRASAAHLWTGDVLSAYGVNVRRVVDKNLGAFMEPAVINAFGASAIDFNGWAAINGAMVSAAVEANPLQTGDAQVLVLDADADSGFEFAALAAPVGAPIVLEVFARAEGNTRTACRLVVDDGLTEYVSDDFIVGPVWSLLRFEAQTQAAVVTARLINASDGIARTVAAWGAQFSNGARWGAMYPGTGTKAKEKIVFNPLPTGRPSTALDTPRAVLGGQWHFRWKTPEDVTPDTIGTGVAGMPTFLSVGNGTTDLVSLKLVGTPATGGAALTLSTRGGGVVVSLSGVEWAPGAEVEFLFDVPAGVFVIAGTNTHDGQYPFPRYDQDAILASDFLVMGDTTMGTSTPVPGYYVLLGAFSTVVADVSDLPPNLVVVNGVPVTYNGAFVVSN